MVIRRAASTNRARRVASGRRPPVGGSAPKSAQARDIRLSGIGDRCHRIDHRELFLAAGCPGYYPPPRRDGTRILPPRASTQPLEARRTIGRVLAPRIRDGTRQLQAGPELLLHQVVLWKVRARGDPFP